MFLRNLTLLNFKNHAQLTRQFSKKVNCIIGNNGIGKTNLLDAIYFLCLTKSYFNSSDQQNIQFGKDFFRLQGTFDKAGQAWNLVYKMPAGKKKELLINDAPLNRLSEHIGHFPAIIITPDDGQLITGSSEERRKFLDSTISQVNHQYLEWVMQYNKVLTQRNAALKQFAETRKVDKPLIETYDTQLVALGTRIHDARTLTIARLEPIFNSYYKNISLEREQVSLQYVSQLSSRPFAELLKDNLQRDLVLQRTDAGIHKDDIDFFIATPMGEGAGSSNIKMKKIGSQGQQKSFVIAIKFAQYEFIKQGKDFKPLLLIDDIFDKLDTDRSKRLIEMIAGESFGQVFITGTDEAHIINALKGKETLYELIGMQ